MAFVCLSCMCTVAHGKGSDMPLVYGFQEASSLIHRSTDSDAGPGVYYMTCSPIFAVSIHAKQLRHRHSWWAKFMHPTRERIFPSRSMRPFPADSRAAQIHLFRLTLISPPGHNSPCFWTSGIGICSSRLFRSFLGFIMLEHVQTNQAPCKLYLRLCQRAAQTYPNVCEPPLLASLWPQRSSDWPPWPQQVMPGTWSLCCHASSYDASLSVHACCMI